MLPTEPLGIGGVLDAGLGIYRRGFKPLFAAGFIVGLLLLGLQLAFTLLTGVDTSGVDADADVGSLGLLAAFGLGSAVLSVALYGAVIMRTIDIALARPGSLVIAFATIARRALPLLAMVLLLYVALVVGLVLLVVPGVYLSISLALAPLLLVVDGLGPVAALRASHRLVRGHWWRTATVLSVAGVLAVLVQLVASLPAAIAGGFSAASGGGPPGMLMASALGLVSAVASGVGMPLLTAVSVAVLNDLRLRHRGDDLEARLAGV